MGKKYHDPAVANPNFTWQYTVIPVNTSIPNVQYEVIEQLALVPEECKVAQKAFALTQNTYDAPNEFVDDPQIKDGTVAYRMVPTPPDGGGGSYPPTQPPAGNPLLNPQGHLQYHGVRHCHCSIPKERVSKSSTQSRDYPGQL